MTKINGLMTIRAYDQTDLMRNEFMINLEKCANATFCFVITKSWMMLRLDIITILIMVSVTAGAVILKDSIDQSLLTYAISVITDLIPFIGASLGAFAEL